MNRPVIHTSVHQPLVDKKPGLALLIFGQYFNRNETWAEQAAPWVIYIARNAYMLQQGKFAAPTSPTSMARRRRSPGCTGRESARPTTFPLGYGFDFVNSDVILHQMSAANGAHRDAAAACDTGCCTWAAAAGNDAARCCASFATWSPRRNGRRRPPGRFPKPGR